MTQLKKPWGPAEKQAWFTKQSIQRSYQDELLRKVEKLKADFEVTNYGALTFDPARYPLYHVKTRHFDSTKKTILITGGVHGYETSGMLGALSFMQNESQHFLDFNILCFPCLSPWAFETINRWNPSAIDPNRSFYENSPSEESALFLRALEPFKAQIFAHFDLHETTDTDNSVFRPELAARDAKEEKFSEIPDGFYLVGDVGREEPEFQKAVIEAVKKVTHIAPADEEGNIIGVPLAQEGVVYYDMRKLSLCGGVTDGAFTTTTEVYPDSPQASPEICIQAQVAAVCGGLSYLRQAR